MDQRVTSTPQNGGVITFCGELKNIGDDTESRCIHATWRPLLHSDPPLRFFFFLLLLELLLELEDEVGAAAPPGRGTVAKTMAFVSRIVFSISMAVVFPR